MVQLGEIRRDEIFKNARLRKREFKKAVKDTKKEFSAK